MLENILKESLKEKVEFDPKISVDDIIRLTLGKLTNYSKYIKPSIKKVNRKRIKEIEKTFNKTEFLKNLQKKMLKTFYKNFEIEIDPLENYEDYPKNKKDNLKDSLKKELEDISTKRKKNYQDYLKQEIQFTPNFFELKIEKITDKIILPGINNIKNLFITKDLKISFFTIDNNKYFNSKGKKNWRKATKIDSKISYINYIESNDLFVCAYQDGFIEVFKIGFFSLRYVEAVLRLSSGCVKFIFLMNLEKKCKFLISTESGCVVLVEVLENSFGLEIKKKVVLKNFFVQEDSVCIRNSGEFCFGILLNSKGFIIVLFEPFIKRIYEFKLDEENEDYNKNESSKEDLIDEEKNDENNKNDENKEEDKNKEQKEFKNFKKFDTMLSEIYNIQLIGDEYYFNFFTYYDGDLKYYEFFYNFQTKETKLNLIKKFYTKFNFIKLGKLNPNLRVGITKDSKMIYFDKNFEIIGKSNQLPKGITKIQKMSDFFILFQKKEKSKSTEILTLKTFKIDEYIQKLTNAGDYLSALNLSLKLKKKPKKQFFFLTNKITESEIKIIKEHVCRSYFKFLIYCQPIKQLNLDSFNILIEFMIKSDILYILNSFYEELDGCLPENIDYISESIINYCIKNDFYDLKKLSENWINKIIEKAFIMENKRFILILLEFIDFGKFLCLEKIIQILIILRLKYPLFKLVLKEKVFEYTIMDAILKIYCSEKKIFFFSKICEDIVKKEKIYGTLIDKLSYEQENFIINFFLNKNVIEIFSEFNLEYSQLFVELYYPFFENWRTEQIRFSCFNNSLLYNYFCLKEKVERPFELFVFLYEKYDFKETKKIDSLFAMVIIHLFLNKKLYIENYNVDFMDIIINILIADISDKNKKNLEILLVDIFKLFKKHKDLNDISFKIFLNKYKKIAKRHFLNKLEMCLLTIEKNFKGALQIFLKYHKKIKNFDIFEWTKKILIIEDNSNLKTFTISILKNLETFIFYSKKKTSILLCTLNNISLNHLEYLESYPEFIITIIEREMKNNNLIEFKFQEIYINLLQKINPFLLINSIKKYNFNLEKTKDLLINLKNDFALIVLENKMGRISNLIDIILNHIKVYVNTSSKNYFFKEKQLLQINFLFSEFTDVLNDHQEVNLFFYCFSEIFNIMNKNLHLNDYDYFHIKILTHEYFIRALKKINNVEDILSKENMNYFFNLDRKLLQYLMKNIENQNTFLLEFLCVKYGDICSARKKNFDIRRNGVSSYKVKKFLKGNEENVDEIKFVALLDFDDKITKNSFMTY